MKLSNIQLTDSNRTVLFTVNGQKAAEHIDSVYEMDHQHILDPETSLTGFVDSEHVYSHKWKGLSELTEFDALLILMYMYGNTKEYGFDSIEEMIEEQVDLHRRLQETSRTVKRVSNIFDTIMGSIDSILVPTV
ncbi:MAG: hypothetical protein NXI00_12235 [Cytophagales bacterium]|nr:hypothetical protein [Cytophagales bacterium]